MFLEFHSEQDRVLKSRKKLLLRELTPPLAWENFLDLTLSKIEKCYPTQNRILRTTVVSKFEKNQRVKSCDFLVF